MPPRGGVLRFLLLFALFLGMGTLVLSLPWVEVHFVEPWTRLNASASAGLARFVGIEAHSQGTQVLHGRGTLNILTGCNGVEALLILLSAVLAVPSPWSRRLLGLLAGTIAILGANLVRLANLIAIARYFPDWLEVFHVYVWQALIVLVAFAIFVIWGALFARVRPVGRSSGAA